MLETTPRLPSDTQPDRQGLAARFQHIRGNTNRLTGNLTSEDQSVQSMPDASPTKWHLAHTTWFFETFVLARYAMGYAPVDDRYGYLFNSYYDHVGARHPQERRGLLSRPTLEEVRRYRDQVNATILRLIAQVADSTLPELARILEVGLNHEQQHQELILTDVKHAFWSNPLLPAYRPGGLQPLTPAPRLKWHDHPGGPQKIGHGGSDFHFDNEAPRHRVHLTPFRLAGRPVTCGEYLEFIEDGGYDTPHHWLSDGWAVARSEGWRAPLYWQKRGGTWLMFTLTGLRTVDKSEPVCHVSFYEADAYARWAGYRLPTEAEWEVFANRRPLIGNLLNGGDLHPRICPCPPDDGPAQMYGDVWEWTSSAHLPYPGYRRTGDALGEYTGKFMNGRMVLRGGSCVTPPDHVRATYRNFLPPSARWQFSGIRLAEDI